MTFFKSILALLLLIAPSTAQVPGTCTINSNGFLGIDSGNLKQVSFLYDLTVATSTSQSVLAAQVIPSLGGAFIQVLSRDVIAFCGGQDTGIVGFKTGVKDIIVDGASCLVPSQNPPCVRVRCGMSVYVKESGANLLTVLRDALQIEADANMFNATVNPQIISVRVDGTSWTFAASPTASPISTIVDASSQPVAAASPALTNGGAAPSFTPPSTGLGSGVPVATAAASPALANSDTAPSLTPPTNAASGDPVVPGAPSPSVGANDNAPTFSSPAAELPPPPSTPGPTSGDAPNNTMLNIMFVMVFFLIAGGFVGWFFFRKVKKNHRRMREKGDDDSDEESGEDRSEVESSSSSSSEDESEKESEKDSDDDSDSDSDSS